MKTSESVRANSTGRIVDRDHLLAGRLMEVKRAFGSPKTVTIPDVIEGLLDFTLNHSPSVNWSARFLEEFNSRELHFTIEMPEAKLECQRILKRQSWNPFRAELGRNYDVSVRIETMSREFFLHLRSFLKDQFSAFKDPQGKTPTGSFSKRKNVWRRDPSYPKALDHCKQWIQSRDLPASEIEDVIRSLISSLHAEMEPEMVEDILSVLHTEEHEGTLSRREWLNAMQVLVVRPDHYRHEEIVHSLQWGPDSTSVAFIEKAIQLKPSLEYLSYDDYGAFYTQCFFALRDIGTEDAFLTLKSCLSAAHSDLREAAEEFYFDKCFDDGFYNGNAHIYAA